MNYFVSTFLISSVILFSTANRIDDAFKYIDEVLSVHVPQAIEEAGLKVFQMPDFSNNFQNRSHDGAAITGEVLYHSGTLTGLHTVNRKLCKEPLWTSGNITAQCIIVFPQVTVKYEGRIQSRTSHSINATFRQREFTLQGNIMDMEVSLDVTASPHTKFPSIKSFTILNVGQPSFRFGDLDEVSFQLLSSHFYHRYNELFHEIFYKLYRKAFERAVESIPYPL